MSPNGFGGNPAGFAGLAKCDEFLVWLAAVLVSQFVLSYDELGEDGSSSVMWTLTFCGWYYGMLVGLRRPGLVLE